MAKKLTTDCNVVTKKSALIKAANKWLSDPETLDIFKNPHQAMFQMFESEFYIPMEWIMLDEGNTLLTPGKTKLFIESLYRLNQRAKSGKISSDVGINFWTGSTFSKRDPAIGKMFSRLQRISTDDKIRNQNSAKLFKDITESLSAIASSDLIGTRTIKKALFNKSLKKLRKLDMDYIKAIDKKDNASIKKARIAIENYVNKDEKLKLFDNFINIIEVSMPQILTKYKEKIESGEFKIAGISEKKKEKFLKEVNDGKRILEIKEERYITNIMKDLDIDTRFAKPLMQYNKLMDEQYTTLRNGIETVINSKIKRISRSRGEGNQYSKRLAEIRDNLTKELMPKYEQGFFPHYVRDLNATFMDGLMPRLKKLDSSSEDLLIRKQSTLEDDISSLKEWVSDHAKGRQQGRPIEYSRNFFDVVKGYVDDVNSFNTTAFLEGAFMDARISVLDMYKSDKSKPTKYMTSVTDFITDMYQAANGNVNMSEGAHLAARTLLAFEFTSKLGWNVRGAARNMTQRALDYVRFGLFKGHKSVKYFDSLKDEDGFRSAQSILEKSGYLFTEITPELLESSIKQQPNMMKSRYIDEDGKIQYREEHFGHKIASGMSWVAQKSSIFHRKAENLNRIHTFKAAFGTLHKILMESAEFQQKSISEGKNLYKAASEIAENYAKNMVLANHFDYADYAKSKLMRGDVKSFGKYGAIARFMFQFQHYGMEFFEVNRSIYREASADISSGAKFAEQQGTHQAMRMGMAYGLAPLLAYIVTGMDISNLVEHDTAKRIMQWATLFSNDPEKIEEAFYGKGPLVSTFGGPLLGDMIDLGISIGLINETEPESFSEYLYSMQSYKYEDDILHTGNRTKIFNTLISTNVSGKRLLNRHLPQLWEGKRSPFKNLSDVAFNELSLYYKPKVNLPYDLYEGEPLFDVFGENWLDITGTRRKKKFKRRTNKEIYDALEKLQNKK